MKASSYGLKKLRICGQHLSEWTSDVTNNYEDLSELYDELLSVWSRYRTCCDECGWCLKILKAQSKWSCLYGCLKAQQQEAMRLQTNAFTSPTWLVN
jgi:hypothetical protein